MPHACRQLVCFPTHCRQPLATCTASELLTRYTMNSCPQHWRNGHTHSLTSPTAACCLQPSRSISGTRTLCIPAALGKCCCVNVYPPGCMHSLQQPTTAYNCCALCWADHRHGIPSLPSPDLLAVHIHAADHAHVACHMHAACLICASAHVHAPGHIHAPSCIRVAVVAGWTLPGKMCQGTSTRKRMSARFWQPTSWTW